MKKIEAIIDGKGGIEIKMDGFQGETCHPELEKVLSGLEEEGIKIKQKRVKQKLQTKTAGIKQSVMH